MGDVGFGVELAAGNILQEFFVMIVFMDMLDDAVIGRQVLGGDVLTAIVIAFQGVFFNQYLHEIVGYFSWFIPLLPETAQQFEQQPPEFDGLAFIFGKIKGFTGENNIIDVGKGGAVGREADMKDGDHIVSGVLPPNFVRVFPVDDDVIACV